MESNEEVVGNREIYYLSFLERSHLRAGLIYNSRYTSVKYSSETIHKYILS